ncbi:MAG TPA: ABC transporter ATP-binding protein [Bacteriovoracaceae bacterium]|nr:ABC transporter ATP-binding protein [Bacteriovoracaceae bacterium]
MLPRLHRSFGSWLCHHSFEFKWFYLGAFVSLYVLQEFQSNIPKKIRELTELIEGGKIGEASVWVFVGLALGILIFRTLSRLLFFYPARVQQKYLRMELLGLLETVPGPRYAAHNQGQIFQILFDDVANLRAFVGFGLLQVCNIIIAAWVLIPKINESDPYLWPAFIPLFLSVFFFSAMTIWNQRIYKKMMEKRGEVQQFIIESYEAKQSIKNFHRENTFIKGFLRLSTEELRFFFKSSLGYAFTGPYVKLGLGASLLWGALLIRERGGSPSDLVFFSGFLYLFLEPVMFMSWVAVIMSQGLAAWNRVKTLHTNLNKPSDTELELKDIPFESSDSHQVTSMKFWDKVIELRIPLGKWTAFIGETGSGKSYLMSKLATVMILKGRIISMVQQEPYLFNDTIQENIFLGKKSDEKLRAEARSLLQIFQLDSLAGSMDEVLGMEVGENGKRLSGGQMKRVALIRSLLSGADVLIWDDPFSSVDIILERKIIKGLRLSPMWNKKTFIISSHRLTTVRLSDEVIFLDKNQGLKAQGPVETKLKDIQFAEFFKEQMVDVPLA